MCVRDWWLLSSRTIRFNLGDRAWAKFQAQINHKRVQRKPKADAGSAGIIHQRGELTVQRLSSEVSGKAQKFSRIGAREFVPFVVYEDLTLANIKLACDTTSHLQLVTALFSQVSKGRLVPHWNKLLT